MQEEPCATTVPRPAKFFALADWIAFSLTSLTALIVYSATLAPTVTLEDSGELAVAADHLGVPHPPGYPVWTLLAWFFQEVFAFKTYMGQPNPAWSIGLMSAFFGALTCGVIAMLVSHSGAALLGSLKADGRGLSVARKRLIGIGAGVTTGLVLALAPVFWSQSVIVEVYSLHTFFTAAILLLIYFWIHRPQNVKPLYVAAFMFGAGMTNHQPLLLIGYGLLCALFLSDRKLFCAMAVCSGAIVATHWLFAHNNILFHWARAGQYPALLEGIYRWLPLDPRLEPPAKGLHNPGLLLFAALVLTYLACARRFLPGGRRCCAVIALIGLGFAFLVYLPLAAGTNPPMNWGDARTWDGFIHLITRGSYERFGVSDVFTFRFLQKTVTYSADLRRQFSLPTALLGLLPFSLWSMTIRGRRVRAVYGALVLWALAIVSIQLEQLVPGLRLATGRLGIALLIAGVAYMGLVILVADLVEAMIYEIRDRQRADGLERIAAGAGAIGLVLGSIYVTIKFLGMANADEALPVGLALAIPLLVILAWLIVGSVVRLRKSPLKLAFDACVKQERWLLTVLVTFVSISVVLVLYQQPGGDLQDLFIKRVHFLPSHVVYALWIGYGLIFALATLSVSLRSRPLFVGVAASVLVTAIVTPGCRNVNDRELLKVYGGSEQNGHDFGWQFGNYQLRGMEAILEELDPDEPQPPNASYPPPMTPNAILFGGTDPGRFVLTYMIHSADVRPDVFLITQNALADHTYMSVMRDLYGDDIWIPSVHESNLAFQRYVQEVRDGTRTPNTVDLGPGRVQAIGVAGVMAINGILVDDIFEHNKFKHDFYIEESYVIPWMYPYMEPHGLILKVNKEKLPGLSSEMVKNDMQFWSWYTRRLLSDDAFVRDVVARKSFSKLRSAIAGLYAYRQMFSEAEIAFKQSLRLYDLSPEANFRLTELYRQQFRFDDAIAATASFVRKDPNNRQAASFLERVTAQRGRFARMAGLEAATHKASSPEDVLELLALYREFNVERFRQFAEEVLEQPDLDADVYGDVVKLFEDVRQWRFAMDALEAYVLREPADADTWLRLAAAALRVQPADADHGKQLRDRARAALNEAVQYGGERYREIIAEDERLRRAFDEDWKRQVIHNPL